MQENECLTVLRNKVPHIAPCRHEGAIYSIPCISADPAALFATALPIFTVMRLHLTQYFKSKYWEHSVLAGSPFQELPRSMESALGRTIF